MYWDILEHRIIWVCLTVVAFFGEEEADEVDEGIS